MRYVIGTVPHLPHRSSVSRDSSPPGSEHSSPRRACISPVSDQWQQQRGPCKGFSHPPQLLPVPPSSHRPK